MCPDDTKQRNDATTTSSSPGVTMMITDPLSISISKPFLRSQSSGLIAHELYQEKVDDDDENDDTLVKSTPQKVGSSQTSVDRSSTPSNHSKATTTTTFVLLQLTFCAVGICTCYICYGVFHEKLLRSGVDENGRNTNTSNHHKNFMGPSFILFTQCITNVIVAIIWQQIKSSIQQPKSSSSSETRTIPRTNDLPHRMLIITSFFYVCAMICSNEAIPHVSYPVAVLGKSCKLIPTMIIGQVISYSSKYLLRFTHQSSSSHAQTQMFQQIAHTRNEWIAAICICIGIVTFHFQNPSFHNHSMNDDEPTKNHTLGINLLCTSLFMDGLLSVCQNILKKSKPRSPNAVETMYYINLYAVFFIGAFCYFTGQFTWLFMTTNTPANDYDYSSNIQNTMILFNTTIRPYLPLIRNLCILNIAAACGQIFIFLTITWFTPVITTMITTTRKFITILLSVLLYGHSFTMIQWFCIIFIFFGLYIAIIGTTTTNSTITKTTDSQISSTHKKTE
jgi:solute carrier family 35 (UDP-galactose transporter), member B1